MAMDELRPMNVVGCIEGASWLDEWMDGCCVMAMDERRPINE